MKPHFIAIIFVFLFSSFSLAQAQNMTWGLKFGLNAGTPVGKAEKEASGSPAVGPRMGGFVRFKVKSRIDLQAEVLYSFKGGSYETPVSGDTVYKQVISGITFNIPTYYKGWVEGQFDNIYLDIPIMARFHTSERFFLLFGPQVSYLLKGKNTGTADIEIGENFSKVTDEPFDESDQLNLWDYSLILAGNYQTRKGWNVDLGISAGLRSIYKSNYDKVEGVIRNIYLYCTIGYTLRSEVNK
ncbi:MAG: PorT family protein [Bacteroidales bacterium]|nr:PorT family protein [Bacteroidales bacterium]